MISRHEVVFTFQLKLTKIVNILTSSFKLFASTVYRFRYQSSILSFMKCREHVRIMKTRTPLYEIHCYGQRQTGNNLSLETRNADTISSLK